MAHSTKTNKAPRPTRHLTGLAAAPGLFLGTVQLLDHGHVEVKEYRITVRQIVREQTRLAGAVDRARAEIDTLKAAAAKGRRRGGVELGYLLDAHHQMLTESRLIRGAQDRIKKDQVNAEAAVRAELSAVTEMFEAIDDPYLSARTGDIADVSNRLIRCLNEGVAPDLAGLPVNSVVVTEELSPADTAMLDPAVIGGIATEAGGLQGHTAIMARALGLPAVMGIRGLLGHAKTGDRIVVDGGFGEVILRPDSEIIRTVRKRQRQETARRQRLARLLKSPAETRDGQRIELQSNIDLVNEVGDAAKTGTDGIGLLRTEFLFMNRAGLPSADEQYEILRDVVATMDGQPVTIRTLDIGGDKLDLGLDQEIAPEVGANPALGLRAIRLSNRDRALFNLQLEAILRASAHGPVRILIPMITIPSELRMVRTAVRRVAARLREREVHIPDRLPEIGAMVETPAAALTADRLSTICDFLSIGTNDLTMYTLAVDRADEQVANLYNPLHPAVLRLIQFTAGAGAASKVPVTLCGEIGGDPRYTALLVGLGLRSLSMSPHNLLEVKERVRSIDVASATRMAEAALKQADSGRIGALVDDFNGLL